MMLKEERELRKWAKEYLHLYPERSKLLLKDITDLVRAVREDCLSAYESRIHPQNRNPEIVEAIRGKGEK